MDEKQIGIFPADWLRNLETSAASAKAELHRMVVTARRSIGQRIRHDREAVRRMVSE